MAFAREVVEDYFVWHVVSVAAVEIYRCERKCDYERNGFNCEGGTDFMLTIYGTASACYEQSL